LSTDYEPRFDPIDFEQLKVIASLSVGQRIELLLRTRKIAFGLIRGRVRKLHPDKPTNEINMLVLKEIERAERPIPRF